MADYSSPLWHERWRKDVKNWLIVQTTLLFIWYAWPAAAVVPAWVVWLPTSIPVGVMIMVFATAIAASLANGNKGNYWTDNK